MSWQAYIDTSLIGTGHVSSAAIFDKDGKDVWAKSADFKISPAEMSFIISTLGDSAAGYANGLKINGQKYTLIRAEDNVVIGKKGKEGVVVVRTGQALILGLHPETVITQQAASTVEGLGEYLKGVGY